ncbi:hypothetical protein SAMN02745751_02525 [Dethiosulfatibacter aminovorans DSM 17477]|uniref:Flavoprotein, HI0933 family n=1 Tax=Dethiosulfatibacter aminovorans DSM 17477 TaxID=1121476 RepID=A0A1M6J6U8_9FIRM|nr:aminoacetone oxidase family FAD-binding enzyme [Dethiosulfatibacter aminovorans]SHJ42390.1 hypothetical protein SAMN02745751_02525 [Dethiosulfatibacter aminovorans DSM 17477]
MIYDVIIVGGGPAGLFAAANIDKKYKTVLLEGNKRVGVKFLMTGAGQCNITNAENIKKFPSRYNNPGFVRKILYEFNNIMLMEYFEKNGLKLAVREDNKVFPADYKASTVVEFFVGEIKKRNHEIKLNEKVAEIKYIETAEMFNVKTGNNNYSARKLILAGGGKSYPATGSDGSLFSILKNIGVTVSEPRPALTSVRVEDYSFKELSGVAIKNVNITISGPDKKKIKKTGDILFTHKDISGPVILNNSRYMDKGDEIVVDFIAGDTMDFLEKKIREAASGAPKKAVKSVLEENIDLPNRLIERLIDASEFDPMKKISEVSKKEIRRFITNCKEYRFKINSFSGFESAMVTSGGVSVDEIEPKNMSWVRNKNLHFIGEMVDIDGETGGYNLQFAFSTAKKTIIGL